MDAHAAARAARASFDLYALGGATPHAAARLASRGVGVAVLGALWRTGADGRPEADAAAARAFVRAVGLRGGAARCVVRYPSASRSARTQLTC